MRRVFAGDYLARPMAAVRTALARCVAAAEAADATIDPAMPAFDDAVPLAEQGRARAAWGGRLAACCRTCGRCRG